MEVNQMAEQKAEQQDEQELSKEEMESMTGGNPPFQIGVEMPVNLNAPSTVSEVNAQGGMTTGLGD